MEVVRIVIAAHVSPIFESTTFGLAHVGNSVQAERTPFDF